LFAEWWAAELARNLPQGMTVNAVSPGNAPGTGADDKMSGFAKRVLVPFMKIMPGMNQPVSAAAGRYLEATTFGADSTGMSFASRPKKMVGSLHRTQLDHFDNPKAQRALWNVTERLVHRDTTAPAAA
jgi:hypothetical protein